MDFRAFVEALENHGRNGGLFILAIGAFFGLVLFWQLALWAIGGGATVWILSHWISYTAERIKRRRSERNRLPLPSYPVMIFKVRNFK